MKGENLFGKPIDLNMGNIGGQVVNKISRQTTSFTVLFGNHSNDSHSKFWLFVELVPQSLK